MRVQEKKPCEYCGAETNRYYVKDEYVTARERRFCNGSCANRARSVEQTSPKTNCQTCNKEIDLYGSHVAKNGKRYYKKNKTQKYCSLECAAKPKQVVYESIEKICPGCNTSFKTLKWCSSKYCSNNCYKEKRKNSRTPRGPYKTKDRSTEYRPVKEKKLEISSCSECYNFYTQKNAKKYCSKECKNRAKARRENEKYTEIKTDLIERSGGVCCSCGNRFELSSYCFHHLGDKKFTLDAFTLTKKTVGEILLEYDKCQLLCHNCHAIHHEKERVINFINKKCNKELSSLKIERRNRGISRKMKLIKLSGSRCNSCGFSSKYTQSMSFHHTNPATKKFELNTVNLSKKEWKEILEEHSVCELLCMNCHIAKNPDR